MLSSEGWVQGLAEITIIGGITWQVSQDPEVYDTLSGGLIKLGPGASEPERGGTEPRPARDPGP